MNIKERKAIIAGNWKLNKRVADIPAFAQELQANLPAERCCDVVICAPYPLIAALETAGQGCHLGVGAQDVEKVSLFVEFVLGPHVQLSFSFFIILSADVFNSQ